MRRLDSGDDAADLLADRRRRLRRASASRPRSSSTTTAIEGLLADEVAAFIADLDGEPVGIAMTIVSHGVAGIYWVGSLKQARGRGIGRAVTAAATNAGFDLGADVASLQASPMGRPIYEAMGY